MATYTGTMYVGGEQWSDTAKGYQIGGNDAADANASCTLPDDYTSYGSCSISCTLYSTTAPSRWDSDWGCFLGVYKNGNLIGGDTQWIDKYYFQDGDGASSRSFTCNLTGGVFEPDDRIQIKFIGSNGGFVDSSGRCVYLTAARFYSAAAVKEYTLSFSANGGSGAPGAVTKEVDSSGSAIITIPAKEPTRSGYIFQGWAGTSGATSAEYEAYDTVELNSNLTLYAVWAEVIKVTLSFSANGGSGAPGVMTEDGDSSGYATFTIPAAEPTRSGHIFLGWATTSGATSAEYEAYDTVEIKSNSTLYAVWFATTSITLRFSANGGRGAPGVMTEDGDISGYATFTIPVAEPTRSGYIFQGWAGTSGATSAEYEAYDTVELNSNLTLYAVWEAEIYRITYDANGADNGLAPTDDAGYTYGTKATLAGNSGSMTLEGHMFGGWNTAANCLGRTYSSGTKLILTGSVTLYAMWVPCEQIYLFDGYIWRKGGSQIFNGRTWQPGELGLQAGNNKWTPEAQVVGSTLFLSAGSAVNGVLSLPFGLIDGNTLEV